MLCPGLAGLGCNCKMQTLTLPLLRHFRATSAPLPRHFRATSAPLPRHFRATSAYDTSLGIVRGSGVEVARKWCGTGVQVGRRWGPPDGETPVPQQLVTPGPSHSLTHSLTHCTHFTHSLSCARGAVSCPGQVKQHQSKATKVSAGQPARRRNVSHGIMAMMMPHCLWLRAFILVALYALGSKRV